MKFQITNKGDLKWIILLLGIVVTLYITIYNMGNGNYNHFKMNDMDESEKQELINFVKEHNNSLEFTIEKGNNIGADISKISFNVDKNQSKEGGEILKPLIEEKVATYTEPLPEMPDEDENNQDIYGVDANNNGVRDDLEIITVREFGYNKELVEVIFAGLRAENYNMYLAENFIDEDGKIPFEYEEEITDDDFYAVRCMSLFDDNYDFNKYHEKIYWGVFNNKKRESLRKVIRRSVVGGSLAPELNQNTCQEFIQKTKDKYSDFK